MNMEKELKSFSVLYEEKYQTPPEVVKYMVSLIPENVTTVLEPTPGNGNIVNELLNKGYEVTAPGNYEELDPWSKFDAIVMNPPFKSSIEHHFLFDALRRSDIVIALLPWFTLINADRRAEQLFNFGLVSVTHLPRRTFPKIKVQTCVMKFVRGYQKITKLLWFENEK
jgi:hypothetical protein